MNTIIDLNVTANVNYNNEASYAIVFGANAGNTTANIGALTTANITKQTTLTSITSAVRDLLIDVQFSNVGVVDMNYAGTWANIGLLQIAPAAWRVSGIRSVVQYNEAFANVKYTDLTGIVYDVDPNYSYVTTVNDQSGNTRTWTTTVDVNAYVKNMINRTYTTNAITQLFSTSTPLLDDEPDVGQTYTITFNSPIGKFGNSNSYFDSNAWANIANTYTFTGNTTTVNANLANIRFAPANSISGNSTFTYTQSRDGNSQVNLTKTLTANVQPFSSVTYTYTGNTVFTPSYTERTFASANILLVGGGGGGASGGFSGAGGGGGGGVYYTTGVTLVNNPYTVTIGQGGDGRTNSTGGNVSFTANNGQDTSMTSSYNSFSVNFGLGGRYQRTGGSIISTAGGAGGTGAGAGGDGKIVTGNVGGAGVTNVLTGTAVLGGGGGGGGQTNGANGGNSYGLGGQGAYYPFTGDAASGNPGVAIVKFY